MIFSLVLHIRAIWLILHGRVVNAFSVGIIFLTKVNGLLIFSYRRAADQKTLDVPVGKAVLQSKPQIFYNI